MNLSKYAMLGEAKYPLKLEPELYWTFKPVSGAMQIELAKWLQDNAETITDEKGVTYQVPPYWVSAMIQELTLSFAGSNILLSEELTGEKAVPMFPEGMPIEEVGKAIALLPMPLLIELWVALKERNPQWGPADVEEFLKEEGPKA